jgi:hypothetical protein
VAVEDQELEVDIVTSQTSKFSQSSCYKKNVRKILN